MRTADVLNAALRVTPARAVDANWNVSSTLAPDLESAKTSPAGDFDSDDELPVPNYVDHEDRGYYPDTLPRRCTDYLMCPLYAVFVIAFLIISCDAILNSKLDEIPMGVDYSNTPCGTLQNSGKPFLYFCEIDEYVGARASVAYPTCVSECPARMNQTVECFNGNGFDKLLTYSTIEAGTMCLPQGGADDPGISDAMIKYYFWHRTPYFMLGLWRRIMDLELHIFFAGIIFGSILFSYLYIELLSRYAKMVVQNSIILIILAIFSAGVVTYICSANILWSSQCHLWMRGPRGWTAAIFFLGVAATLTCFAVRDWEMIEVAIDKLTLACRCIIDARALRVGPLFRVVTWLFNVAFCVYVLACSWSTQSLDHMWDTADTLRYVGGKLFSIFVVVWTNGTIAQFCNLSFVYISQIWYFKCKESAMMGKISLRAYWHMLRYHAGSMVLAGVVVPCVSPLRLITEVLHRADLDCAGLFEGFLDGLSHHGMTDVAFQGHDWCNAARHAQDVLSSEATTRGYLRVAYSGFCILGLAVFAIGGFYAMLCIIWLHPEFSDPTNVRYIASPRLAAGTAAFIAAFTAFPFMMIFGPVSESILYCEIVENQRSFDVQNEKEKEQVKQNGRTGDCSATVAKEFKRLICLEDEPAIVVVPRNHHVLSTFPLRPSQGQVE
eukprot:TRINITY_DN95224_c0_g1_i1.p1 TRINITY_DN95224_c0_g1~~TRINITY_DN95224_c0_g1_i1.p1  ORF type:complete len:665 (-),score=66.58 TRINITY_DN95224_c0_g1_i1:82-2076(-)